MIASKKNIPLLASLLNQRRDQTGIIYVLSQTEAGIYFIYSFEDTASELLKRKFSVECYHASINKSKVTTESYIRKKKYKDNGWTIK